jgi:hypothetical protein
MRAMQRITLEESIVALGRIGEHPQPAINIDAAAEGKDALHAAAVGGQDERCEPPFR